MSRFEFDALGMMISCGTRVSIEWHFYVATTPAVRGRFQAWA